MADVFGVPRLVVAGGLGAERLDQLPVGLDALRPLTGGRLPGERLGGRARPERSRMMALKRAPLARVIFLIVTDAMTSAVRVRGGLVP